MGATDIVQRHISCRIVHLRFYAYGYSEANKTAYNASYYAIRHHSGDYSGYHITTAECGNDNGITRNGHKAVPGDYTCGATLDLFQFYLNMGDTIFVLSNDSAISSNYIVRDATNNKLRSRIDILLPVGTEYFGKGKIIIKKGGKNVLP